MHEKEKTFTDAYVNHIGKKMRGGGGGGWNEKEHQYLRCIVQIGTDTGRRTSEDAVMARTISESTAKLRSASDTRDSQWQ